MAETRLETFIFLEKTRSGIKRTACFIFLFLIVAIMPATIIFYAPVWSLTNGDDAKDVCVLRLCWCLPLVGHQAAAFTAVGVGLRIDGGNTYGGGNNCSEDEIYRP